MSDGRLAGIEVQGYENDGEHKLFVLLKECDYLYLREQAERKQELEKKLFKEKAEVYRQQIIERNARKVLEREFR